MVRTLDMCFLPEGASVSHIIDLDNAMIRITCLGCNLLEGRSVCDVDILGLKQVLEILSAVLISCFTSAVKVAGHCEADLTRLSRWSVAIVIPTARLSLCRSIQAVAERVLEVRRPRSVRVSSQESKGASDHDRCRRST